MLIEAQCNFDNYIYISFIYNLKFMYSFKEKVWLRDTTKAHVLRDVQKYAVR